MKPFNVTEAEAQVEFRRGRGWIFDKPCIFCGGDIALNYSETMNIYLMERCVCFRCNYWCERMERIGNPNQIVIGHSMYQDSGDKPNAHEHRGTVGFMGFGGHRFYWKMLATGEIRTSNDLWSNGKIPEHFRSNFVPNAEWSTKEEYDLSKEDLNG